MNWYLDVLKKYAVFDGRARRKEYWFFALISTIISIILSSIDGMLGVLVEGSGVGALNSLYGLAVLVPSLAVASRRLHDTNHSAWWMLIALLPVIGWIILLVFLVSDSQDGSNEYGKNPKKGSNPLDGIDSENQN